MNCLSVLGRSDWLKHTKCSRKSRHAGKHKSFQGELSLVDIYVVWDKSGVQIVPVKKKKKKVKKY